MNEYIAQKMTSFPCAKVSVVIAYNEFHVSVQRSHLFMSILKKLPTSYLAPLRYFWTTANV